jgi:V-type H+-transporting ATPase subunit C
VIEEADWIMYGVTILRGHYEAGYFVDDVFSPGKFVDYLEPLRSAFREKRFILRELNYDATKTGGVKGAIERASADLKQCKTSTIRWCQSHFGEVYSAYLHLKVVQAFVESVLRYGLPVDFTCFFVKPDPKQEKETKTKLTSTILSLRPELRPKKGMIDEEDEEDNEANLPYILLKFTAIGSGNTSIF